MATKLKSIPVIFAIVFLVGCSLPMQGLSVGDAEKTAIANGVSMRLTSEMLTKEFESTNTFHSSTETPTSAVSIGTISPFSSSTVVNTRTLPPSLTPYPSLTPMSSVTQAKTKTPTTATSNICDQVTFISTTVPDGSSFLPGDFFTKGWRLKNTGTCTWTTGYALVFVSGAQMEGQAVYKFTSNITPGQSVDLSINLRAPASPGTFSGNWMLRNANNKLFGAGAKGDQAFQVSVKD